MNALLALRARLRFAAWVARLRLQLRRRGGRLVIQGRARFDGPPHVVITPDGEGGGVFTLRLGDGVRLGRDLHLEIWAHATTELALADGVYFQHGCRIQLRGGSISLGPHSHVRDGALLRSGGVVRIGAEVTVGAWDTISAVESVVIDDRAGLGERTTITDSDHTHDGGEGHFLLLPLRVTPVHIGPNVLISANVVIMRGARVGANSVIAANAVVGAGEHPPSHILAGIPARALKPL